MGKVTEKRLASKFYSRKMLDNLWEISICLPCNSFVGAAMEWHHRSAMNAMNESQELARRFNEDEAVWRCYERKRALRKCPGLCPPLQEEILDDLDWLAAEQECRVVRAVGFFLP